MAILRYKDMEKMSDKERQNKLQELRLELIKANVIANKTGKIKIKEIRRTIAKLLTFIRKPKNKQ